MFKGLRNRFLMMHMGIVTLIVFMFFGAMLFSNYQNMQRGSDIMLNQIFDSRMEGSAPPERDRGESRGDRNPPPYSVRERFSPAFTVELNGDNTIKQVNSMFALDDEFYVKITKIALEKNEQQAQIKCDGSHFKFKVGNSKIVFLDITKEWQMFMDGVYTFLWIAVPLLVVIFLISLYFANRSIRPIEAAYNKQNEFIADASHELRTPLAVISTNADMLMDDATQKQQRWLDYIKQETGRMTNLTDSLLYLTRLDYVDEPIEHEPIDFGKIIQDYLLPQEAVFYEKKIQTEIDISPDICIKGDKEQIRRLVGILIDNAIKYTDGGIRVTLCKSGNEAKLCVCNTGQSIPQDEIENIWNRFYRVDKSRQNTGGFGLGLAIAKAIADKHGGTIAAKNSEDNQIKFTVKIPLCQ